MPGALLDSLEFLLQQEIPEITGGALRVSFGKDVLAINKLLEAEGLETVHIFDKPAVSYDLINISGIKTAIQGIHSRRNIYE